MLRLLQLLILDSRFERIRNIAECIRPGLFMLAKEQKPVYVKLWDMKIFEDAELKVMSCKTCQAVSMLRFYPVEEYTAVMGVLGATQCKHRL